MGSLSGMRFTTILDRADMARAGLIVCLALFISVAPASAGYSPIVAKAVYVKGAAYVISIKTSRRSRVRLNMPFAEGDRLITRSNGAVEIRFDTGDLIRLDKNTDMVIRSLHRDSSGSTFQVFSLLVGRVKSAVSKLFNKASKFEYRTKTAICGVAGTPPFFVEYSDEEEKTSIDLVGKKGEPGALRVTGLDVSNTVVTVLSGFGTNIPSGGIPDTPMEITPQRFRQLNSSVRFHSRIYDRPHDTPPPARTGGVDNQNGQQNEGPGDGQGQGPGDGFGRGPGDGQGQGPGDGFGRGPGDGPGGPGQFGPGFNTQENLVINDLSGKVSRPPQVAPEDAQSIEAAEDQSNSGQGMSGQTIQDSDQGVKPPPTARVNVRIDLK